MVALGEASGDVSWGDPRPVDLLQVVVVRPTGDGAGLSDVDRNVVLAELGKELAGWRHSDAFQPLCRVVEQELCRVAAEDDRHLVSKLDRAVGSEVKRNRRASRIGGACAREVRDPHRANIAGPMTGSNTGARLSLRMDTRPQTCDRHGVDVQEEGS